MMTKNQRMFGLRKYSGLLARLGLSVLVDIFSRRRRRRLSYIYFQCCYSKEN